MKGGCLCGAVRYEVNAPAIFGANCYCSDCRKITSSHSTVIGVPEAAVTITGETRSFTSTSDSGNPVTRMFCPTCGAGLFSKGKQAGLIMVKAGTLDDPKQFTPAVSVYVSSAPAWDRPPADMPGFDKMPPQA